MRKVLKKVNRSLSSTYSATLMLIVFVCYLSIGNIVDYVYGTKVAKSLIFNGPFFGFLLFIVLLTLVLSFLRRLPFRMKNLGFYLVHIGLISLFSAIFISENISHRGTITLGTSETTNEVLLDQYQISIKDKESGETKNVDLNFSVRPQGLNLKFGPTTLITYLPYSIKYDSQRIQAGEISSVIIKKPSSENDNSPAQEILLSTNNLEYPSVYKKDGIELILLNEFMLKCIENLSKANPHCATILQRRSIDKIKSSICHRGKFLITNTGFFEFDNNCRLEKSKIIVSYGGHDFLIKSYFENTLFEKGYRYSDNFEPNSDIVKYFENDNSRQIKYLKLGEHKEVISRDGRFFKISFGKRHFKLPFNLALNVTSNNKRVLLIDNSEFELIKDKSIEVSDWSIELESLERDEGASETTILSLIYDPLRQVKLASFILFCLGLIIYVFQVTRERRLGK